MSAHIEAYVDKKGEWRWRMRAANGEVVADSAEGYSDRVGCYEAISRVLAVADAIVRDNVPIELIGDYAR